MSQKVCVLSYLFFKNDFCFIPKLILIRKKLFYLISFSINIYRKVCSYLPKSYTKFTSWSCSGISKKQGQLNLLPSNWILHLGVYFIIWLKAHIFWASFLVWAVCLEQDNCFLHLIIYFQSYHWQEKTCISLWMYIKVLWFQSWRSLVIFFVGEISTPFRSSMFGSFEICFIFKLDLI